MFVLVLLGTRVRMGRAKGEMEDPHGSHVGFEHAIYGVWGYDWGEAH